MSDENVAESTNGPVYVGLLGLMVSGFGAAVLQFGLQIHPAWAIVPGALIGVIGLMWAVREYS